MGIHRKLLFLFFGGYLSKDLGLDYFWYLISIYISHCISIFSRHARRRQWFSQPRKAIVMRAKWQSVGSIFSNDHEMDDKMKKDGTVTV